LEEGLAYPFEGEVFSFDFALQAGPIRTSDSITPLDFAGAQ